MFNKTTVVHKHMSSPTYGGGVSKVTVTENKAPTDKSVALLMEMEQKALDKIIGNWTVNLETFGVTASVVAMDYNLMYRNGFLVCVSFKINNHPVRFKYNWDGSLDDFNPTESFIKAFQEALCDELLPNVVNCLVDRLPRKY